MNFDHRCPIGLVYRIIDAEQEQACEALEIFDELMETEVAIVLPHIKSIIEFCLEIAANEKLGNAPRVRALSHLSWVISLKKKTIKKHKLVSICRIGATLRRCSTKTCADMPSNFRF